MCVLLIEKNTQPRSWELRFIWQTFWGLQAQETASQIALSDGSKEVREEPGHIEVLQPKPGSQNIKHYS